MDWKKFILQAINFLRPKFYNRLTWIVVITGISLIVTPLYQQILIELAEKYLSINLPDQNLVPWGFALIVSGLCYHYFSMKNIELNNNKVVLEKERQHIEHDQNIFTHADEMLSGTAIHEFLSWLQDNHSYHHQDYDKLRGFCHFLSLEENYFLTNELQDVTQELLRSSLQLLNFLDVRFFIYPDRPIDDGTRSAMQPENHPDRSGNYSIENVKIYDSITAELNSLIEDLRDKYRVFRGTIKEKLII